MNIYSRENKIAWEVTGWLANHEPIRWACLWEDVIRITKDNCQYNFIDSINTFNNNYAKICLIRQFRRMMRNAVTLANKRKRIGSWGKCIDDIFNDIEVSML